jgi:hypothetical protein
MKQPYVSTLIEQDFSDEEKSLARDNIAALSSADLGPYATKSWVEDNFLSDGDFSEFVTEDELDSAISGKMDISSSADFYPRHSNPEGYITSADIPPSQEYSGSQYIDVTDHVITASGLQPKLPTAQEDQYLTTDDSGQLKWEDKLIGVPAYTNLNRGQILGINYSSQLYWRNTYKRTLDEAVRCDWTSADDSTGYVDGSLDLSLPDDEYKIFLSIELSNMRAYDGSSVTSFSGAIQRIELYLGDSSNPTRVRFGMVDTNSTGTNGYGSENGGSWLMSHYRGSMLAHVDRVTIRFVKRTGATITGYSTSVGVNYVEF